MIEPGALQEAGVRELFHLLATLLITLSGLSLILQARAIAARLMLFGVGAIVLGAVGPSVIEEVPAPVLLVGGLLVALAVLKGLLAVFIGRDSAGVAIGVLVAFLITAVVFVLVSPFKAMRRLLERGG